MLVASVVSVDCNSSSWWSVVFLKETKQIMRFYAFINTIEAEVDT